MKQKNLNREQVATKNSIDLRKPLVKEFIDEDQSLIDLVLLRIPHMPYSIPKIACIYCGSGKLTTHYRVNWYREVATKNSFVPTKQIVASLCYKLTKIKDGYEVTDITNSPHPQNVA